MDVLFCAAIGISLSAGPTCLLQHQQQQRQHPGDNNHHHLLLQQHDHLHLIRKKEWYTPLSISLGLSLSLFALSVLEATPTSWLVVLDNRIVANPTTDDGSSRDDDEYRSLCFAYFVILTLMAGYVLVVCPSMAGIMVVDKFLRLPSFNTAMQLSCCSCCWPTEKPWWLKIGTGIVSCIFKAIFVIFRIVLSSTMLIVHTCWGICFRRRCMMAKKKDSGTRGLPITMQQHQNPIHQNQNSIDAESTTTQDSRVSVQCLISSCARVLLLRGGICLVGSLTGVTVTLILLHWLAPFLIEPRSMENWLAVGVCWMTSIGILLSQIINGFGSVSMPHSCLAGLYLDPIRQETVTKATIDLEKTEESLQSRKQKLKEMRWKQISPTASISPTNVSNANGGTSSFSTSWSIITGNKRTTLKRTFSSIGEEVAQQKKKLLQEIMFLETLVEEMREDVDDMKYTQQMEAQSRTTMGRIKSWLGVIFSVVLVARLYFAAMAIWRHWYSDIDYNNGEQLIKKDPVTTALIWLAGHDMVTEKEYNELSQFISLLLTAILSFSQIRTFLRTVAAIHRRLNQLFCRPRTTSGVRLTPRNNSDSSLSTSGTSLQQQQGGGGTTTTTATTTADEATSFPTTTGVYIHILAALMGSYFLACIVMTKAMLPWQYRASFSGALGGLDAFTIQSDFITLLFAMSAVASAIVLALLFGIQKSNAIRHNVSWMDDLITTTTNPNRDLDV